MSLASITYSTVPNVAQGFILLLHDTLLKQLIDILGCW